MKQKNLYSCFTELKINTVYLFTTVGYVATIKFPALEELNLYLTILEYVSKRNMHLFLSKGKKVVKRVIRKVIATLQKDNYISILCNSTLAKQIALTKYCMKEIK